MEVKKVLYFWPVSTFLKIPFIIPGMNTSFVAVFFYYQEGLVEWVRILKNSILKIFYNKHVLVTLNSNMQIVNNLTV